LDAPLDGFVSQKNVGNLLATASLHISLAIFTAASLTKLSPAAEGAFAFVFFQATEKEARTALLWV